MNDDRLLTTAQVAERVRVDVRTVTRWLRAGRLRGHKSGRSWRIAPADLEAFLETCANRPNGDAAAPSARERPAGAARTRGTVAGARPPEIEIRPFEFQPIEEPSYLKVRTYPRPTDRTVRLGVIEWIGTGPRAGKVLVNRKPMSHSDAMAYAKRFAEEFRVPLIYQREDEPLSAASDRSGAE